MRGSVGYTPNVGFSGTDRFRFKVIRNVKGVLLESNIATVTIIVAGAP
jgi:hypothetical protein